MNRTAPYIANDPVDTARLVEGGRSFLKAHDPITNPAYVVIKAANQFRAKTTRPNEM